MATFDVEKCLSCPSAARCPAGEFVELAGTLQLPASEVGSVLSGTVAAQQAESWAPHIEYGPREEQYDDLRHEHIEALDKSGIFVEDLAFIGRALHRRVSQKDCPAAAAA